MISSDRFGGRGTTAGSRVQIRSACETEPGTRISAEQQARWSSQHQLLSNYVPHVNVGCPFQQWVEVRVIGSLWIAAEHRRVNIDVHLGFDIGQATTALALHYAVKVPPPEILPGAGGLQLT
jgi:hypothetical protein